MSPKNSIGTEKAIALYESEWWKEKSYREIADFNSSQQNLVAPFMYFKRQLRNHLVVQFSLTNLH